MISLRRDPNGVTANVEFIHETNNKTFCRTPLYNRYLIIYYTHKSRKYEIVVSERASRNVERTTTTLSSRAKTLTRGSRLPSGVHGISGFARAIGPPHMSSPVLSRLYETKHAISIIAVPVTCEILRPKRTSFRRDDARGHPVAFATDVQDDRPHDGRRTSYGVFNVVKASEGNRRRRVSRTLRGPPSLRRGDECRGPPDRGPS